MATFEVCSNTEWLRGVLDIDAIEDGYEDDAANCYASELHRLLCDAGFQTERAKGQRILFHGWNGANTFKHLLGPIGTFDDLTTEEKDSAWAAIEAAKKSAEEKYARS